MNKADIFEPTNHKDNDEEKAGDGDPFSDELDLATFLRESGYLRSLFPEEVWIALLKKITVPEDLHSLSNSSPYFRHLLRDQLVTFLSPKVIQVLALQYEEDNPASCYREEGPPPSSPVEEQTRYSFEGWEPSQWEAANWDRYHWMEEGFVPYGTPSPSGRQQTPHHLTGIMKCRLVCSSWNKAIENYYEQKSSKMECPANVWPSPWEICEFNCYHETPRRFVEHFAETHNQPLEKKNPFLGRSVEINGFVNRYLERDFINYLRQALEAYGEEIWYCVVFLPIEEEIGCGWDYVQKYSRLREWLELMPNLKTLKICSESTGGASAKYVSLEIKQRLSEEIGRCPMPTLEYLEFLDLTDIPAVISNEVIRANNHVYGLRLQGRTWSQKVPMKKHQYKCFSELGYKLAGNLERLGKLEIVICSEEMLRNLEKLTVYLELPMELDFILGVKNTLECLSFVVGENSWKVGDYNKLLEGKQRIEFYGFEDCMEISNVWEIFERLKVVQIRKEMRPWEILRRPRNDNLLNCLFT